MTEMIFEDDSSPEPRCYGNEHDMKLTEARFRSLHNAIGANPAKNGSTVYRHPRSRLPLQLGLTPQSEIKPDAYVATFDVYEVEKVEEDFMGKRETFYCWVKKCQK